MLLDGPEENGKLLTQPTERKRENHVCFLGRTLNSLWECLELFLGGVKVLQTTLTLLEEGSRFSTGERPPKMEVRGWDYNYQSQLDFI